MQESPLQTVHQAAGARLTAPDQGGLLLTYGDVPAEYAAGTGGALLFDDTRRGLVSVAGEEAPGFLHRLLANDVRGLEDGQGGRNLLLSGKGKVEHDFHLVQGGGGFQLSTVPDGAAGLATALDMYLFAEAVEIEDQSEQHAPLSIMGPAAAELLAGVLGSHPGNAAREVVTALGHEIIVSAVPVAGSPGWRLDAGPAGVAELWNALVAAGAQPAGQVVRDILRIEAGRARWGNDIAGGVYPQEARLEEAFSLDKGCYIGQEVVAKIDTYGGLNKRLEILSVDHDDPLPRGARLLREDGSEWRDLGIVTSWSYSFVLDTGIVLAYVKRRHQDVGTTFRIASAEGDVLGEGTIVAAPLRAV